MRIAILLLSLMLTGCFRVGRTVETEMTLIPLPEKPTLTRVAEKDVQILGAHAMKLRNLIIRYNQLADEHNVKNGFPGKQLPPPPPSP